MWCVRVRLLLFISFHIFFIFVTIFTPITLFLLMSFAPSFSLFSLGHRVQKKTKKKGRKKCSSEISPRGISRGNENKMVFQPESQEQAFATENQRGDTFSGFIQSLFVMLSLEFGDRTFFIASCLSGKHDPKEVFFGALLALWLMTFVSVIIGMEAASLIPRKVVHYGSVCLFVFYGVYSLYSASRMPDRDEGEENEELKEVEEELNTRDEEKALITTKDSTKDDSEIKTNETSGKTGISNSKFYECLCNVSWMQTFILTFIAEWGDRSQIATVALAGDYEPFGIIFGCFLGHSIATGTACVGGKYIANKVSEKKMTILSGSVFLVFAALTLLQDPNAKVEKVDWRPSWMVAETENAM